MDIPQSLRPELRVTLETACKCANTIHLIQHNAQLTASNVAQAIRRNPDNPTIHESFAEHGRNSLAKLSRLATDLREQLLEANDAHIGAINGKLQIGETPVQSVHHGILDWAEEVLGLVRFRILGNTEMGEFSEVDQQAIFEDWPQLATAILQNARSARESGGDIDRTVIATQEVIREVMPLLIKEAVGAERNYKPKEVPHESDNWKKQPEDYPARSDTMSPAMVFVGYMRDNRIANDKDTRSKFLQRRSAATSDSEKTFLADRFADNVTRVLKFCRDGVVR